MRLLLLLKARRQKLWIRLQAKHTQYRFCILHIFRLQFCLCLTISRHIGQTDICPPISLDFCWSLRKPALRFIEKKKKCDEKKRAKCFQSDSFVWSLLVTVKILPCHSLQSRQNKTNNKWEENAGYVKFSSGKKISKARILLGTWKFYALPTAETERHWQENSDTQR